MSKITAPEKEIKIAQSTGNENSENEYPIEGIMHYALIHEDSCSLHWEILEQNHQTV